MKPTSVVYSPDGRRVAVAFTDLTVRIFDTADGEERLRLEDLGTAPAGHHQEAGRLACDPSGRWIAACRNRGGRVPGEVRVFDATTGERIWTLSGHTSDVTSVTYSPDGRRIATSSYDMTVKLWETETGQEVFTLRGHTGGVNSVAFSPDGQRLATGSIDLTAKIWDVAAVPVDRGAPAGPVPTDERTPADRKEEETRSRPEP